MLGKYIAVAGLAMTSLSALAEWSAGQVDVAFLSSKVTKADAVVLEINHFKQAEATLDRDGSLHAEIVLDSLDTGIDLRTQRIKEWLFTGVTGGKLKVTGTVDSDKLRSLAEGEALTIHQPLHLSWQLSSQDYAVDVSGDLQVVKLTGNRLLVSTVTPYLLDLSKMGVDSGVKKLVEVAGLATVGMQLPVFLNMTLSMSKE